MGSGIKFHKICGISDPLAPVFNLFAEAYLDEIGESELGEGSVEETLLLQKEPKRWLLIAEVEGEYAGFVHAKIDTEERPGWGYVIEFYVAPKYRCHGLGHNMWEAIRVKLAISGVQLIWLSAVKKAEKFWCRQGFVDTGIMEYGEKIFVRKAYNQKLPSVV
ncbi:MAG TPA: GNAT family N-acetyltransferase [Firmicutes bacterium]|jgi:GNAT superfamily N-acetyltransferase|nr:GNAT family N-acetyltransferase [Bacillota bacterium]